MLVFAIAGFVLGGLGFLLSITALRLASIESEVADSNCKSRVEKLKKAQSQLHSAQMQLREEQECASNSRVTLRDDIMELRSKIRIDSFAGSETVSEGFDAISAYIKRAEEESKCQQSLLEDLGVKVDQTEYRLSKGFLSMARLAGEMSGDFESLREEERGVE